jgi:hypothetical protein
MSEFWKILPAFLASCFFGKIGVSTSIILFKLDFVKTFAVTAGGGITGSIFFTYLWAGIIKWWKDFKVKYFKTHTKSPAFTKQNRRIIRIKQRFGLYGIAFSSPILLSIPFGCFLCERFYKKKSKVILAMCSAVIFWTLGLYFIFYALYKSTVHLIH